MLLLVSVLEAMVTFGRELWPGEWYLWSGETSAILTSPLQGLWSHSEFKFWLGHLLALKNVYLSFLFCKMGVSMTDLSILRGCYVD